MESLHGMFAGQEAYRWRARTVAKNNERGDGMSLARVGFEIGEVIEYSASAADEFIAPFLANTGTEGLCIICKESNGRRARGVCIKCAKVIEVRSLVASRLRSYRADGKRHNLAMATQKIRQYGIKPEDIKGY